MRSQRSPLAQSLAAKVILSTVLLSLGVVWLTGSALYSQLSDGIKTVNLESSLADARSVFYNARYQFLLVEGASQPQIQAQVTDVITSSTSIGTTEGAREIILLKIFGKGDTSKNGQQANYSRASNGLLATTIPENLRSKISKDFDLSYQFAPLTYRTGDTIDALYVGQRVSIPDSGRYEMYLV